MFSCIISTVGNVQSAIFFLTFGVITMFNPHNLPLRPKIYCVFLRHLRNQISRYDSAVDGGNKHHSFSYIRHQCLLNSLWICIRNYIFSFLATKSALSVIPYEVVQFQIIYDFFRINDRLHAYSLDLLE